MTVGARARASGQAGRRRGGYIDLVVTVGGGDDHSVPMANHHHHHLASNRPGSFSSALSRPFLLPFRSKWVASLPARRPSPRRLCADPHHSLQSMAQTLVRLPRTPYAPARYSCASSAWPLSALAAFTLSLLFVPLGPPPPLPRLARCNLCDSRGAWCFWAALLSRYCRHCAPTGWQESAHGPTRRRLHPRSKTPLGRAGS